MCFRERLFDAVVVFVHTAARGEAGQGVAGQGEAGQGEQFCSFRLLFEGSLLTQDETKLILYNYYLMCWALARVSTHEWRLWSVSVC